jgi:hypothetical protein
MRTSVARQPAELGSGPRRLRLPREAAMTTRASKERAIPEPTEGQNP